MVAAAAVVVVVAVSVLATEVAAIAAFNCNNCDGYDDSSSSRGGIFGDVSGSDRCNGSNDSRKSRDRDTDCDSSSKWYSSVDSSISSGSINSDSG